MNAPATSRPARGRWWPAFLIVVALAAWIAGVWLVDDLPRQFRVMRTGAGVLVAGLLLGVWWLFLSRLRWRIRWLGLGVVLLGLIGFGACFRFHGVTGDLVPLFEPRWAARGVQPSAPVPPAESAKTVTSGVSFPQFLGPTRDGVVTGVRLARDWGARPPQRLWRQRVGEAWGGFAIVGDRALTQEQDGAQEQVVCYGALDGRRLWTHSIEVRYDNPLGGVGPRATPTVVGDRVFAIGAMGNLSCLELATGRLLWGTNVVGGLGARELEWGVSGSPLVEGGVVIVAPHGVSNRPLAAYRADSGAEVWLGTGSSGHYSSPRRETILGVPQLLTFGSAVSGHDPSTGAELWRYPWRGGHPHVTDPRVVGTNRVLISSGYGTGSELIEFERERAADGTWPAPQRVWKSMRLKSKFANILIREGLAYGLDDGRLVCLDLADGTVRWQGERYGHGQLLLVGDSILLTAESGEVVLVEASAEAFREVARFQAVDGKTWNPPALAGDLLIVRNDREAAAYRLPTER